MATDKSDMLVQSPPNAPPLGVDYNGAVSTLEDFHPSTLVSKGGGGRQQTIVLTRIDSQRKTAEVSIECGKCWKAVILAT